MESLMESIEISSIKAAALRPVELLQADSVDPRRDDRLKETRKAFNSPVTAIDLRRSQLTHNHQNGNTSQLLNASESLPNLLSTVPDSQAIANVEQLLQEIPNTSAEQVMRVFKKMGSQGAPQDTQPISPDFLEDYKSKSHKSRRSEAHEEETGFTHGTLHPGDEGHIDLLSSYRHDCNEILSYPIDSIAMEDEEKSEPVEVDFSPTQHVQSRLSQYPESQRFKTPVTIGKKRDYNGDMVESPVLPRNPLARNGHPTPARAMGLSQAFEATQAASSPFVNGIPSELRSDRPSPAFAMQPRLNISIDSSPTLARTSLLRSSTEPQTKYVSMQESQAIREARRKELEEADEEDPYDSFDETPAEVRIRRAIKRRNEEADKQFAAVISTRDSKGPRLSPTGSPRVARVDSSPAPLPVNGHSYPHPASPADLPEDAANASEEETDQEDLDLALRNSSQMRLRAVPEEDKENAPQGAIQIPETIALHRVMNGHAPEVQASPSVRYISEVMRSHSGSQGPQDGEAFVVANSPLSQIRRYVINGPRLASSGEETDFVPQSQFPYNNISEEGLRPGVLFELGAQSSSQRAISSKTSLLLSRSDTRSSIAEECGKVRTVAEDEDAEEEEPPRRNLRSQAAPQVLSSTIPETSSARPQDGFSSSIDRRGKASKGTSEFETAPTHPSASSNEHNFVPATRPAPTPNLASPVRTKRKRMTDIDAEQSQTRSSGPDLGDLNPILIDREYREIMGSSSPTPPGRHAKKRRSEAGLSNRCQRISSSPIAASASEIHPPATGKDVSDEQEPRTTQGETPPASSDDVRAPVPQRRGLSRPTISADGSAVKPAATYGKTRSKPSAWDIQASPEQSALSRNVPRTTSMRRPPSVTQVEETRRASTPQLSRATTQRSKTNEDHDVTPAARNPRQSRAKARVQDKEVTVRMSEVIPELVSMDVSESKDHSAPPGEIIAPNQVLACYNGKARAYYPAASLGVSGTEILRYQIQWDGYEPDEIDEHGVRSLDLRYGDYIKINLEGFPKTAHVIRGFKDKIHAGEKAVTDIRGYKTILVALKQRKSLPNDVTGPEEIKEVPMSAIYLDSNMWNQMKNRSFTYIVTPVLASSTRPMFSTPMERPSTPSTPSSRSRRLAASTALPLTAPITIGSGIFANMAFAISYDSMVRKSELTSLITSNGGLVLTSGFQALFQLDAMMLKQEYANLGFTALLADKHSRKEKYLQALALGLPCLSGKWLEACVAREGIVNWQSYLLPAGESDELEGAIKSRVLSIYEPVAVRVSDVIESRADILNADSVIFVLGRGKAEEKRRPYIFLTQALGAGHVERASDIRAAKVLLDGADGTQYKWIFVDDRDVETATLLLTTKTAQVAARAGSVKVVGNEFVKQSLVLGRMFAGL